MAADASAPGEPHGRRRANGALEREVLAILQAAPGALTAAEVMERLGAGLTYSTVVTTLARLRQKGVLERTARGRAHAYAPVTDQPGLAARHMRQTLEREPDRATVLTRFVDDLSPEDEQVLRRLLGVEPHEGLRGSVGGNTAAEGRLSEPYERLRGPAGGPPGP